MTAPLLLNLTHTSHTRARTGIQRVARSLWRELGPAAQPITFDPYEGAWRPLDPWEQRNLETDSPGPSRTAHWPWGAQGRGVWRRWRHRPLPLPALPPPRAHDGGSAGAPWGLLMPEIFSPAEQRAFPGLFAAVRGPRVAIFNDAIALKYPELTPPATVARFPGYLRELAAFDGIAAISEDSRNSLLEYWRWLGLEGPPVAAIPLGIDLPAPGLPPPKAPPLPVVLCVGTLEGRKNHRALLEACELLWAQGAQFELRLIGLAQTQTGRSATERVASLQAAGRPLRYEGAADEAALEAAYAECLFTVYPSLSEGFGLPVAESLGRGKPCVCLGTGALGEIGRGGGCALLPRATPEAIAETVGRLLRSPGEVAQLTEAAARRKFRRWSEYATLVTAWMGDLPRRG